MEGRGCWAKCLLSKLVVEGCDTSCHLQMALNILHILHLFSPTLQETLEGTYDYPYDIGEEFQAQRSYPSLMAS